MPSVVPLKGALAAVPPEELRTLCYTTTSADFAGEALPENGAVKSMRLVREVRKEIAAAGNRRRTSSGSDDDSGSQLSAAAASSVAPHFGLSTLYNGDFIARPLEGFGVDRELAKTFRPPPGARPAEVKHDGTAYAAFFARPSRSRVAAARPEPVVPGDNALGGLIAQSYRPVTASHSKRQHKAHPKELVVDAEQMPYPGCPYWLGAGSSASNFLETRYQLEFSSPGQLGTKQSLARRSASRGGLAASAPELLQRGAVEDPERVLRAQVMRSHYKLQYGASRPAYGRHPGPDAASIRQTIIGR